VSEKNASSAGLHREGEGQAAADSERRAVILVVDDERANRRLLRACLDASYEVHDVDGAAAALELLERTPVDLVLLDVMMPGVGGLDLCREIKRTLKYYLPVILVTGLVRQDDRNAGLQAGADDFLTKPFDRHELLLRVRTFLKLRFQDQRIHAQLEALSVQERLIRRQIKELEERSAMKDDLVSLMVHDLRNPLTGIAGFLGMLTEETKDPEMRAEAAAALQASDRIRETLDDLLCIRMLETGTLTLHREHVTAESIVEDAIASIQGAARARRVQISALTATPDLVLNADRKLARRAVENLLSNALKYTPEGTIVRTAIRETGNDVQIEVADRGCGVPEAFKPGVFRKFASVEAARGEARRGVGLGLYLVNLVATAHGGHTSVRDRKHGGAAFGLYLPRADAVDGGGTVPQ
jgi:two-component system, sensor histidine kinase and response regulator